MDLSIITSIKTDKEMINLDKRDDGNWRLIYSEKTLGDISKIKVTIETDKGTFVWKPKK
jgi:hypothetical protein